ncbi:MAG TPA: nucleoside hydrolase [Actinomycetota bacterium]
MGRARAALGRRVVTGIAIAIVAAAGACDAGGDGRDRGTEDGARLRVVVDTDMGFDDVTALLYLLRRDDVDVAAVTVAGDGLARCDAGVANALGLLALAGEPDVPVACGPEAPLVGSNAFPDGWRDATEELAGVDLPETGGEPTGTAVELLRETLDGRTALLTLGPFTNVAEAIREEPALADRVDRVVSMAGAVHVPGNAPQGLAEYNVWIDPVAADEVLRALPVVWVPLDATDAVPVTPYFVEALGAHPTTPEARAVHGIMLGNEQIAAGGSFLWDPLAAILLVEPDLADYRSERLHITASQDAGAGWMEVWPDGVQARIAATVPEPLAVERELISTLSGEPVDDVRPTPDAVVTFDGAACRVDGGFAAGRSDVVFRNDADGPAVLVVIQLEAGTTFRAFADEIGPPGSTVRGQPASIVAVGGTVEAPAGGDVMWPVETPAGPLAVACLQAPDDDPQGAPRVWLARGLWRPG